MGRVRVILEGERVPDRPGKPFWLGEAPHKNVIDPHAAHVVSIEDIPDPDPEWWPPQPGDVVLIGDAAWPATWLRELGQLVDDGGRVWTAPQGGRITDAAVLDAHRGHGDVTLIVRDGKPVLP